MSEEIKVDHFKDILKQIDLWYREDDIEYTRWFGFKDLYNLKIYITSLQQKVEQLENIRKEAIEYITSEEYFDLNNHKTGSFVEDSNNYLKAHHILLNILNKGSDK